MATRDRITDVAVAAEFGAKMLILRVTTKWSICVVDELLKRSRCFNELKQEISGISPRSLSRTLKMLERDGLIVRQVEAAFPVTVRYAITSTGRTLEDPINVLRRWSATNVDRVIASRAAFDTRSNPVARD